MLMCFFCIAAHLTEVVYIMQQPYEYDAKFEGTAWTSSYAQMGADNFSICSVGSSFNLFGLEMLFHKNA